MQKCTFDVKLSSVNSCNGKEKSNGCHFDNKKDNVNINLAIDMCISFGNQLNFIVINVPIRSCLVSVQPSTSDN